MIKLLQKILGHIFIMLFHLVTDPNHFKNIIISNTKKKIETLKSITFKSLLESTKNTFNNIFTCYNTFFKFLFTLFKFLWHLNAVLGVGIVIYFNPFSQFLDFYDKFLIWINTFNTPMIIWIKSNLIRLTNWLDSINPETKISNIKTKEVKSSIFSNIFELFDSMDIYSKIALSILAGNSIIVSCLISIIFIFYGNLIIEKYQIEKKYPNLFRIINLRRKFQKYYLITSISYIFIVTLTQIIFCIHILSTQ